VKITKSIITDGKNKRRNKKFYRHKKIMGSNLVVRANTFDELGRFSPDFGVGAFWGAGEETDLVWKAYFNHKKLNSFTNLLFIIHLF